jgi:hypothetical protein
MSNASTLRRPSCSGPRCRSSKLTVLRTPARLLNSALKRQCLQRPYFEAIPPLGARHHSFDRTLRG